MKTETVTMLASRFIPGIGAKNTGDQLTCDAGLARQLCDDQGIAERVKAPKAKPVTEEM